VKSNKGRCAVGLALRQWLTHLVAGFVLMMPLTVSAQTSAVISARAVSAQSSSAMVAPSPAVFFKPVNVRSLTPNVSTPLLIPSSTPGPTPGPINSPDLRGPSAVTSRPVTDIDGARRLADSQSQFTAQRTCAGPTIGACTATAVTTQGGGIVNFNEFSIFGVVETGIRLPAQQLDAMPDEFAFEEELAFEDDEFK